MRALVTGKTVIPPLRGASLLESALNPSVMDRRKGGDQRLAYWIMVAFLAAFAVGGVVYALISS